MSNFLRFRNCSLSPFSFVILWFAASGRGFLLSALGPKTIIGTHGRSPLDDPIVVASVAALLLVTALGSTLLHWHSDWNDQRCQLCHVRHLPSALGPVAEGPACPVLTERDWSTDNPAYELESFFVRFSSRAPPRSTSFTVS